MTETLTPYLCVPDSRAAVDWYREVFGAVVSYEPIVMDDGRIGHVELSIGSARLMMSDPFDSVGVDAPDPARGTPVTLHLGTGRVDEIVDRARELGARIDREPADGPHGRTAVLRDPSGHRWMLNSEG